MKLYFAPMEGITGYIYRNAHAQSFGGCDAYFSPFITPSENGNTSPKNMKDILPERNSGINLKVQAIVNKAEPFIRFAEQIKELGYKDVNINFGCPAGTVVKKKRGAGALCDTYYLDKCLEKIFSEADIEISVKTRIGFTSGDEMEELSEIYNKYPISLLIIHPRTRKEFYNGKPDLDVFRKAYNSAKSRVCYNGNIFSVKDCNHITSEFSGLHSVMIGRGAVANPAIFREIRGGKRITTDEIISFSDRLANDYYEILKSDIFTLNKMKEVWVHMLWNYPDEKKIAKAIKKSGKLCELRSAIQCLPEIKYDL